MAEYSSGHTIVVEKSTVPVRTAELIQNILSESEDNSIISSNKKSFSVLSSPEFLAEGTAINDLENPDRVLIGGEDNDAIKSLSSIYERWIPANKILLPMYGVVNCQNLLPMLFGPKIKFINAISALVRLLVQKLKKCLMLLAQIKELGKNFLMLDQVLEEVAFRRIY